MFFRVEATLCLLDGPEDSSSVSFIDTGPKITLRIIVWHHDDGELRCHDSSAIARKARARNTRSDDQTQATFAVHKAVKYDDIARK